MLTCEKGRRQGWQTRAEACRLPSLCDIYNLFVLFYSHAERSTSPDREERKTTSYSGRSVSSSGGSAPSSTCSNEPPTTMSDAETAAIISLIDGLLTSNVSTLCATPRLLSQCLPSSIAQVLPHSFDYRDNLLRSWHSCLCDIIVL